MALNQINNSNHGNQTLFMKKDQGIENKVKSIVSQLPGSVKNISFKFNSKAIAKAKITIVVSSKEEALKARQNIDDEIDIKVIIRDEPGNRKSKAPDGTIKTSQETNVSDDKTAQDLRPIEKNIYAYNRGPDGKIYGIIKEAVDTTDFYIQTSKNPSINSNLRDKYINIYKRYSFKNIKTKENTQTNRFSINI